MLFDNQQPWEGQVETLRKCLEAGKPRLMQCGGAKRLLVLMPESSARARPLEMLHRQLNETPSVAQDSDGDFVLCDEVERISLTQVAVTLIERRRDYAEFASRLHTRTDVSWSPLPDLV